MKLQMNTSAPLEGPKKDHQSELMTSGLPYAGNYA